MNKRGATSPLVWVAIALVVVFLLYRGGVFEGEEAIDKVVLPSDLQTDVSLTCKDELATTETLVNCSYIVFNGDGTYYDKNTEGVGSDGTDTFTARVDRSYDMWVYHDGAESVGYIAKKVSFSTGSEPKKPVTVTLVKRGGLEVSALDDPIDLDTNLTGTAGATEEFRVKWKVNVSNSGVHDPILRIEVNGTRTVVEDLTITKADSAGGKWDEITCPGRLDPALAEQKLYCFKRDKDAYSADGVILTYVSMIIGSSGAGSTSTIKGMLVDSCIWLEPGYTTISGINFGAEDHTEADVGITDSWTYAMDYSD